MMKESKAFCPNPLCRNHRYEKMFPNWYVHIGYYYTKAFGFVPRFKCRDCGKSFSTQTFSLDYYAKKKVNYQKLLNSVISKSGNRTISRELKVSTGTVQNRISRLSRQCITVHETCKNKLKLKEDLVADGFESFAVSQNFPDNIQLLAGNKSQYIYFMDYATIRRKGRMTKKQKHKRENLEKVFKADPKGVEKSFYKLLDELSLKFQKSDQKQIRLYTDEKKDYQRALKKHPVKQNNIGKKLQHIKISSRLYRNYQNKLFTVNYLDREIRKSVANHVRETQEFTRNVNDGMNRMILYLFNHNYIKKYRIKDYHETRSHAEVAGMMANEIKKECEDLFKIRKILSLEKIERVMRTLWKRGYITPLLTKMEYLPKYALM